MRTILTVTASATALSLYAIALSACATAPERPLWPKADLAAAERVA